MYDFNFFLEKLIVWLYLNYELNTLRLRSILENMNIQYLIQNGVRKSIDIIGLSFFFLGNYRIELVKN